jgi:hypothetical protein
MSPDRRGHSLGCLAVFRNGKPLRQDGTFEGDNGTPLFDGASDLRNYPNEAANR